MPPQDHTITLDQENPTHGDQVTFTYNPDPVEGGWLLLQGYQDDVLVYSAVHAAYDDGSAYGYHMPFVLDSASWEDGQSARCVAEIRIARRGSISKSKPVASVEFTVAA